ncbi:MAG: DJ-1/PfpI family protein [Pseudomonadota bacterium]
MNIGIYIYDKAEVLDFSGPFEVFSTAQRLSNQADLYNVFLVSETGAMVSARGNFNVIPDFGFAGHPEIDILIVVGGIHTQEIKKPAVLNWINQQSTQSQIVASVCTGAFLLAAAGILTHQKVTTHWEDIPDLRTNYPRLELIEGQRWVDAGNIISSGGISAGIDMSLYLVSKTSSLMLAEKTAKQMEFDWTKNQNKASID